MENNVTTTTTTTSTTTTGDSTSQQHRSSSSLKLVEQKFKGHKDSVVFVTTHLNKPILASSSDDCTVRLWDIDRGSVIKCINNFNGEPVNSIAFDKENLIYCAHSNKITCFDLRNDSLILKESVNQLQFNTEEINQITFDSKFQYMASCDDSGAIKIIDIQKNKLCETLKKHTNVCSNALFRPNSKNELISGSYDYCVIQWDYLKAKLIRRESFQQASHVLSAKQKEKQQRQILNPPFVHSLDLSHDGKLMAIGLGSGDIAINDISSFSTHLLLDSAHSAPLSQVHFPRFSGSAGSLDNSNSHLLLSAGNDSNIILWDIEKKKDQQQQQQQTSNKSKNNKQSTTQKAEEAEKEDAEEDQEKRIKAWTQHHSIVNWLTTSNRSTSIYIADTSNDITVLTIQ
ncbi:WD40 repeat-containing protein [Heterostelium album PN500]|uniref:WD40 repeat-containing protein n=1 Tax=Heterostelium pallidum (strain ATCC 26659 / Pp 5 / PN500) TaxID=670386 RepID=D3B8I5_HETP5|nr:WD40 repeat-containing protein [Heterostelium album PN500]EFA82353.1 WD40 repeat-containing protein [Heterostelium album PN500]|eukprot:XP_020434470.1 WD40 repeat-containing protein [Heterostelium album PN500]